MIANHAGRNRKTAHSYQHRPFEVNIVCFIHRINSTDWQIYNHFLKDFRIRIEKYCFHNRQREGSEM